MAHVGGGTAVTVVAVAGGGLTGASWAGLFAAHGLPVRLYDPDADAADAAVERARAAALFLVENGLAEAGAAEAGLAVLSPQTDPEAAYSGVGLVQECVTERLETKRSVFSLADRLTPPNALIATSSSGLSISDIQAGLPGAARCLAAHPYNPPHIVPLVELAPGTATSPETLERARAFYSSVGKDPVVLDRDVPGYIANRLSAALWREAVELVRSGVATVAEVDQAVRSGPGLRWAVFGPHMLYHLGGGPQGIRGHVEHLAHVKEAMLRDLATWTTFPGDTADVLEAGIEEEAGGRRLEELAAARDAALVAVLRARAAILEGQ
jgi:carnitine 3-dehydrogenase